MSGWAVFGLMALLPAITVALIWASVRQDRLGAEAVRDLNRLASDIKADRRSSGLRPLSQSEEGS